MIGYVDHAGRALLEIEVASASGAVAVPITTWIDTGFTGDLVLPQTIIDQLALVQSGKARAVLADGSQVLMLTYECYVRWFDKLRRLEVVSNAGKCPLLGIGLLKDRDLRISYQTKAVLVT